MGTLNLGTLGTLRLSCSEGGDPSRILSQPKRFALLVYLALAEPRGYHRRDSLLTLFWPELDDHRARNALSQSLSFLRRELPEGIIQSRGTEEVGLDHDRINTGVESLEKAVSDRRWADALDLYTGDFLKGFHLSGALDFDAWVDLERERLRELAAGAAWSLAGEQIERGALVEAERTAQRALNLVWTDETPVREFMRALAGAGDRAAALNLYERFCARLKEELDLGPSQSTAEVAEAIRNGESPAGASGGAKRKGSDSAPPTVSGSQNGEDAHGESDGESRPGGRRSAWHWSFPLSLVVLAAVATRWFWPSGTPEVASDLVAVAPFHNRTGDPAFDLWGDLIANRIEDRLSRASIGRVLPGVRVNPVLRNLAPDRDPIEALSRDLAAGTVVTGSIDGEGDFIDIVASCVDASSGEILATIEEVHGRTEDIASLIPVVQDRVAAALAFHLDPADWYQSSSSPPLRLDAYEEFRRGVDLQVEGETWGEAANHFLNAWALDSTYLDAGIAAYIQLDQATQLGQGDRTFERDSVLDRLGQFQDQMTRSQKFQLNIARYTFSLNLEAALREARAASEYFPLEMAYELGHKANFLNRATEALEAFQKWDLGDGQFLDGFIRGWPYYFHQYAEALHRLGRHREELEIILEGRRRYPDHADLRDRELVARIGLGQTDQITNLIAEVRSEEGGNAVRLIARELFAHGLDETAVEVLEEEVRRFGMDPYYFDSPSRQATVLHYLKRDDEAHALFEKASAADPENPWLFAWVGITAPLVGDTAQAWEVDQRLADWPREGIPRPYNYPFVRAQIQTNLGNRAEAVRLLEDAYFQGGRLFFFPDHTMFDLLPLKGFPPYDELMRPKG